MATVKETKRVVATGFESFIIEEWEGWDLLDTAVFQFYDCKPAKGCETLFEDGDTVVINLDNQIVTVYKDSDDAYQTIDYPFELRIKTE